MNKYSAKIIVATHKKFHMPTDDMYIPLHVGAEGKKAANGNDLDLGYQKDNTGDNISYLNTGFCELTGLYWAWKNLEADYIGLTHYRRHFSMKGKNGFNNVLTFNEIMSYLGKVKLFIPTKRNYYIETLFSHYDHTHYIEQLNLAKEIIAEKYPEYLESFDRAVYKKYGHMFNMMIMEKGLLNEYCSWIFEILFELRKRIDDKDLSDFEKRFYGRVSEIIFNVWLDKKMSDGTLKESEVMEIPYINMERVNWLKKGKAFLAAKFFGKKYQESF